MFSEGGVLEFELGGVLERLAALEELVLSLLIVRERVVTTQHFGCLLVREGARTFLRGGE